MDFVWLVVLGAVAIFLVRVLMIARQLKAAARNPGVAEIRALREAKANLRAHREHLESAVASPKRHLEAARAIGRPPTRTPGPSKGIDAMVEEYLPERRL